MIWPRNAKRPHEGLCGASMVAGVRTRVGGLRSGSTPEPRVGVGGGGLAGVACAKQLADDPRTRVTLLDRTGYHQFQPLLYQVAMAELTGKDMSFDLARMFAREPSVD